MRNGAAPPISVGGRRDRKVFLLLRGFLFRNLRAFLTGLRKPNGDRLLAALHLAAFAAGTRFQRAALLSPHCAFNGFSR
jgi:hypothetical protein